MINKFHKTIFTSVFILLLMFSLSIISSSSNFGEDQSGMQSKYKYEVMYDYDKKYKLHYGPEPTGQNAWMVADGFPVTDDSIQTMAYTPDGNFIIIGDGDGKVIKIDLTTRQKVWEVKPYDGETSMNVRINYLTVSPDGKYVALGCRFQYLGEPKWFKILNIDNGETISTIKKHTLNPNCHYQGQPTFLCAIGLKFSKDSRYIFAMLENEKTGNWGSCSVVTERYLMKIDFKNGKTLWHYKVPVLPVIGPDINIPAFACALPSPVFDVNYLNKYIAVGECNGNIIILNQNTGREVFKIPSIWITMKPKDLYGDKQMASFYFSNTDSDTLYISSGHSAATYLHSSVSLSRKTYTPLTLTSTYTPIIMASPDNKYLAAGGEGIFIWDNNTGKNLTYILYRVGPDVKHHFKPIVNPVYKEFAAFERHKGQSYLLLIHQRPARNKRLNANTMNSTGIFVSQETAFFIKGNAKAVLDYKNEEGLRGLNKNFDMPVWHTSFRIDYYVYQGGELYIKPQRSGNFTIYGGKTRTELDNNRYRSRLAKW